MGKGTSVAETSIALSRKANDKEKTSYLKLVFFNKLAELASQYLTKGSRIQVECMAEQNVYTDKNGQKRYDVNFIVQSFICLDKKNG